jgi:hypothetical protein
MPTAPYSARSYTWLVVAQTDRVTGPRQLSKALLVLLQLALSQLAVGLRGHARVARFRTPRTASKTNPEPRELERPGRRWAEVA